MRTLLMVYDIPEGRMSNPAPKLRKRGGIQINLSAWVFREEDLPSALVNEMRENGATVELVRFDEAERETILRLASQALEREAQKIRSMLSEGVRKASERFEEAKRLEDGDGINNAAKYVKSRFRAAKQRLASATTAMMCFQLSGNAATAFEGLNNALIAEQEAFFVQHSIDTEKSGAKR